MQSHNDFCCFLSVTFAPLHYLLNFRVFSERELVRYMLSPVRLSVVCLSVCRLSSVTFVRPTQAVEIFVNISTALGTLAIR